VCVSACVYVVVRRILTWEFIAGYLLTKDYTVCTCGFFVSIITRVSLRCARSWPWPCCVLLLTCARVLPFVSLQPSGLIGASQLKEVLELHVLPATAGRTHAAPTLTVKILFSSLF